MQIALTTLEEVFLNIAKRAEIEAAENSGKTVTCELEPGLTMQVPIGADYVKHEASGVVYNVHWAQDDKGELTVDRARRMEGAAEVPPAGAAPPMLPPPGAPVGGPPPPPGAVYGPPQAAGGPVMTHNLLSEQAPPPPPPPPGAVV